MTNSVLAGCIVGRKIAGGDGGGKGDRLGNDVASLRIMGRDWD